MIKVWLIWVTLWSILAYFMYGSDKKRAREGRWRIPEMNLLLAAYFGGAFGAYLGMKHFSHKTRHIRFRVSVPMAMALWIVILIILIINS